MFLSLFTLPSRRRGLFGVIALLLAWAAVPASAAPKPLSLNEALAYTLERHPELAQFPYRRRAAEARELQAGLRPNPELAVEVENIGGSGRFSGTDSAEASLVLSQLIELGGKRGQREDVARYRTDLVDSEYRQVRWQVLAETVRRYLSVAEAQENIQLAELSLALARESRETIQRRVQAGTTSDASLQRSAIAVTRAELALESAQQQLASARVELAAQWGETEPDFERVRAALYDLVALPEFSRVRRHLEDSPQLSRYITERRLREAELQLARARGRQDLRVGVGVKQVRETDDHAFTLSLSMPLGVSDRNQGEIRARRAEYEQLALEEKATRVHLMARIQRLYQELEVFRSTALRLRGEALPSARAALESIRRGYQEGLYTYLELVDARQERLAVERDALQAAVNFHQTLVTLEQLTGTGLTGQWSLTPDSIEGVSEPYEPETRFTKEQAGES
ncbi:TolC family protein [Marinimicrobium sp. C6131]|uniref:TolC family protein n=1 Tax=Marinimicrobium sp. C6131 TaxID=3022676 RepID=UPI00223E2B5A|nr:TolC family protein [Marinimicrobium sp. C6131]UZJ43423.1 TolC family protein [Marinimicrobium sp. C6131]